MKIVLVLDSVKILNGLKNTTVRRVFKVFLVITITVLSVIFFGFFLPGFLIGQNYLRSLGVANLIYIIGGGGIAGLVTVITTSLSLKKTESFITHYCMAHLIAVCVLLLFSYVVALHCERCFYM